MTRLEHKKILITQSDDYMGPAIADLFACRSRTCHGAPGHGFRLVPTSASYVQDLPDFDVVIANLAHDPCNGPIEALADDHWEKLFDTMVHPLMALVRHFAPRMADRGHGKIIAITSAAPLRGFARIRRVLRGPGRPKCVY